MDLVDAMAKTQLFEDWHDFKKERSHTGLSPRFLISPSPGNGTTRSTVNSPTTNVIVTLKFHKPSSLALPVKRLSPAEIKEKCDKGLCFTCDEKYNFGHKCKNRVLILCTQCDDESEATLAPPDQEDFEDRQDGPTEEVSLNSLANSSNP